MKKISRRKAEELFDEQGVVESKVGRIKQKLRIELELENGQSIRVEYDSKGCEKSYFIQD